jgi:O-antigen/teichoic acid export membrane protein
VTLLGDPHATVARGVKVNALGTVARVLHPVAFAVLTRWYGPEVMGIYLLATAAFETVATLATGGLNDAVVALVSPVGSASDAAYRLLASAFVFAVGAALVGAGLAALSAHFAPAWLPQSGVGEALALMAPALPLACLTGVVVAATRARYVQVWDVALQGVARPALIIVCGLAMASRGTDARTLATAYVLAHGVTAAAAVVVFARFYSWRRLLGHARSLPLDRSLLAFTLPQNLNMGLYALTRGASALALGTAGMAATDVALFSTGQAIAQSLRQVRVVFTSAMAPVVATLHAERRRGELQEVITRAVRLSLLVSVPVAVAMVLWRDPLLRIFHPTYMLGAVTMSLLVAAPLANIVAGFASNAIVMAGHVGWNLFNTLVAVMVTYGATWVLAPRFGVLGAALAAAAAGVVVAAMQVVQARVLVGVTAAPWTPKGRSGRAA